MLDNAQFEDKQMFCLGQQTGQLMCFIEEKLVNATPEQRKIILTAKCTIYRSMVKAFSAPGNRYQMLCDLFDKAEALVLSTDQQTLEEEKEK
jgi:hypothetical protein